MSKVDLINADLKDAMRSKDKTRLEAIRAVRGEILKIQKASVDAVFTDDDFTKIIKSQVKEKNEVIQINIDAGREEAAALEAEKRDILQAYLPPALSEDELKALIADVVAQNPGADMKSMGKIMGATKKAVEASGKDADMGKVSGLIKAALQG